MAITWQTARTDRCWIGLDWNVTTDGNDKVVMAPIVYRSDTYSTDNYGSRFDESLNPDPNSAPAVYGWWGYFSWGSGSGDRVIETFAQRTYTKTHDPQTVTYQLHADASFGTWDGGFVTIGERYFTFTYTIPAKTSYAITYYANGGSGAPGPDVKWYGESKALSSTVPTRTNYTFKNWNTKADGTGTSYAKGATYTGNAELTLYAQWTLTAWDVTYYGNGTGATSVPAKQTKIANTTLKLTTSTPSRPGYNFLNWNTKSDGKGTTYRPGENYTVNAALNLYAMWQLKTYTISYSANGGSGAPSSQTKTHGTNLTLSSTKPTKTGYNFVNWKATNNQTYSSGATYSADESTTMTAQWSEITYAVTYNGNASNVTQLPSNQTKRYTTNLTLTTWSSGNGPKRTGYRFSSWNTKADGTGTAYQPGDTYSANAAVTLYAQWSINTYTVSYNGNGTGSANVPSSQTKTYNTTLTLSSTVPTREPYKFLGWATSSSGDVAYQPGTSYTSNSTVTLYAKWENQYSAPVLTNVFLDRCSQDGTVDDEGLYAKITGTWSVDTRYYTNLKGGTATVSLQGKTGTQSLSSASSGTFSIIVGPYSESTTGTGTVYFTDGRNNQSNSVTVKMEKVQYPIDVMFDDANSSYSVGILSVAPSDGLEVGDDMSVVGQIMARGGLAFSGSSSLPHRTDMSATLYPLMLNAFNAGGTAGYVTKSEFLEWLPALPLAGGMMTGPIRRKSSTFDITAADNGVESYWNPAILVAQDKNDNPAGYLQWYVSKDGYVYTALDARNQPTGGGTATVNYLRLRVDKDGTRVVQVADPAPWRTALGLGTMATQSSDSYLPISGGTLTGALSGTTASFSGNGVFGSRITLGKNVEAEENGIIVKGGGSRSGWVLKVISASDGNGDAILLGDGGLTIIGAGESASNLYTALLAGSGSEGTYTAGSEHLFLAADNDVHFSPGCGTIGSRHDVKLSSGGNWQTRYRDVTIAQGTTSGTSETHEMCYYDHAGTWFASFVTQMDANRRSRAGISLRNMNNSGTWVNNGFSMYVTKDGTPSVSFDQPAKWRAGLSANGVKVVTATGSYTSSNSGTLTMTAPSGWTCIGVAGICTVGDVDPPYVTDITQSGTTVSFNWWRYYGVNCAVRITGLFVNNTL